MCSNPYIDEILIRQHIAEARAEAAQRQLLSSGAPRPVPLWARARRLLYDLHCATQAWWGATSKRGCRHRFEIHTEGGK